MTEINFYKTQPESLIRILCKISEKCYYSNLNALVITKNRDYSSSLDKSLWTYSKNHFIPHATIDDPLPEKQPILITDKIHNPNKAQIIIFVNPAQQILVESTAQHNESMINQMIKIIFILDETNMIQTVEIKNIIDMSKIVYSQINYFIRNIQGTWQNITPNNH